MDRILRATPGTAQVTFYEDGQIVDPGTVTVTVTSLAGQALPGGTAAGAGIGARTFNLAPATHTALLDSLTLTWASTAVGTLTTTVEVVGGFLFSVAEARATPPLDSAANFSTADIESARIAVEQALEEACGVAFVPRFALETFSVPGRAALQTRWPKLRALRSATVNGTVVTDLTTAIGLDDGVVYLPSMWTAGYGWTWFGGGTVLGYEHGMDEPPGEIKRAALKLAKTWLVGRRNPIDDRAITFASSEGGTYSLAVPGRNGSYFGDPDVDAAIDRYSLRVSVA